MEQFTLSKNEINSFVGDIRTLSISGTEDLSAVIWTASDPEIVKIREFDDYKKVYLSLCLRKATR